VRRSAPIRRRLRMLGPTCRCTAPRSRPRTPPPRRAGRGYSRAPAA
jgi:hypothetical protein